MNATLVGGTTSIIDTTNADATWNGNLLADGIGAGSITKIGGNKLTVNGSGNTYTGLTTVAGGTFVVGAASGIATSSGVNLTAFGATLDVSSGSKTIKNLSGVLGSVVQLGGAGKTFTFGTSDNTTFNGGLTGTGSDVTKQGTGTFTFGGSATGVGYFNVNAGTLATTKSNALQGTTHVVVLNGGTWDLTGAGLQTVSDLQVNAGGTLSATLGNGHDNILLTAGATIGGTLSIHRGDGNFPLASDYTLITGNTITYTGNVIDDMPLVTVTADHSVVNTIKLHFVVSGSIASLGTTPNEQAVGGAINNLGSGNSLYDSLVNQTQAGGEAALQQLAGDFHASTKDALILDASFLAGAAGQRLDFLGSSNGGGGADLTEPAASGKNLWLQGYGQAVNLADGSGNAGDTQGRISGSWRASRVARAIRRVVSPPVPQRRMWRRPVATPAARSIASTSWRTPRRRRAISISGWVGPTRSTRSALPGRCSPRL